MKKIIFLSAFVLASTLVFSQSEKYIAAMQKNITELDGAMQKGNFSELANNFERIGDAEKTQWLPYYYSAYALVSSTYMEKDKSKIDGIADKAEQLITKAETLAGGENSETCVIKSMIATSHMMVDPQNRWQQYGQAASTNTEKARTLDPTNPRPVYLEAQSKFYTPEAFGGGKPIAKPIFEKALGMFATFKPATVVSPTWGKAATEYFLSQCN